MLVEDLFDAYLCTTYHGHGRERTVKFGCLECGGVIDVQSSCGVCLVAPVHSSHWRPSSTSSFEPNSFETRPFLLTSAL